MSVQITIVGLGQIGASFGLALKRRQNDLHRVGNDRSPKVAKLAQKMGAVDDTKINLPASVSKADIVLLSLPVSEIRKTMEVIAPDLQEGAVVIGMSPLQEQVAKWAQEFLPENRYYVGLVPAINPEYLHRTELGVDAATEDLFDDGLVMLSALPGVPEHVIKAVMMLAKTVGAATIFSDMMETDGLMAGVHIVPQLLAAAMLETVIDQPGWREARKLAGRPFATLTAALAYQDEATAIGEAALLNSENVTHKLDVVIATLQSLRDDISNDKREELTQRLEKSLDGRLLWFEDRKSGDWLSDSQPAASVELPTFWEQLIGTRKRSRPEKK